MAYPQNLRQAYAAQRPLSCRWPQCRSIRLWESRKPDSLSLKGHAGREYEKVSHLAMCWRLTKKGIDPGRLGL